MFRFSLYMHYNDVIMSAMVSQITSLTVVYSDVYPGTDQRKHQSSASLAFVRRPVNSPHKGPVTRKIFPFDDVIMASPNTVCAWSLKIKIFIIQKLVSKHIRKWAQSGILLSVILDDFENTFLLLWLYSNTIVVVQTRFFKMSVWLHWILRTYSVNMLPSIRIECV